ncbi:MAG: hypothetical protein KJ593_02975 [Candidatus Omnitrophica bacterium]|nr:hypothetical protein [Candidatus Omnitrophota bacterium]
MKPLVVFYSRTGITKQVAEDISNVLGCDDEEIIDTKDRSGAKGYVIAGKDAVMKKGTVIEEVKKDPASYDLVIIGTPVWGFTMACAIRTYIEQKKEALKRVAFFITQGSAGGKKTLQDMEKLCGQKPVALMEVLEKEVKRGQAFDKVKEFVDEIKKKLD